MIARRGKSKRSQVLRAHFIEKKGIRKIEKSSTIFLFGNSIPKSRLTKTGKHKSVRQNYEINADHARQILIIRVYNSFLPLKILRASNRSRSNDEKYNLLLGQLVNYRALVKSKNARYAFRIGPEMFVPCAPHSCSSITYVIEPFPTSHGLASPTYLAPNTSASRAKEIITSIIARYSLLPSNYYFPNRR